LGAATKLLALRQPLSLLLAGEDHPLSPLFDALPNHADELSAGLAYDGLFALRVVAESDGSVRADRPDDVRRSRQAQPYVVSKRDQHGSVAGHESPLQVVPDLDLPRCQDVGGLPHRLEEELGVEARLPMPIVRVVSDGPEVSGVLSNQPSVVL
jgi:hypothetical protein